VDCCLLLGEMVSLSLHGGWWLLQVMREVSSTSPHDGASTEEGAVAGHCCFEISKEAEEHAQRDFVACRRSDRNLKAADLHRWLTMARLFALSHGDTKVRPAAQRTHVWY
jgi:hypothetical protein